MSNPLMAALHTQENFGPLWKQSSMFSDAMGKIAKLAHSIGNLHAQLSVEAGLDKVSAKINGRFAYSRSPKETRRILKNLRRRNGRQPPPATPPAMAGGEAERLHLESIHGRRVPVDRAGITDATTAMGDAERLHLESIHGRRVPVDQAGAAATAATPPATSKSMVAPLLLTGLGSAGVAGGVALPAGYLLGGYMAGGQQSTPTPT